MSFGVQIPDRKAKEYKTAMASIEKPRTACLSYLIKISKVFFLPQSSLPSHKVNRNRSDFSGVAMNGILSSFVSYPFRDSLPPPTIQ